MTTDIVQNDVLPVQEQPEDAATPAVVVASEGEEGEGNWVNCTKQDQKKSLAEEAAGKQNVVDDDDDDVENPKQKDIFVPTDLETGLGDAQVEQQRRIYGANEIPVPSTPLYVLFLRQFIGFLPLLIEVAALISLAVQDYTDFGIICGMLVINATLGFREEYHAKKSLDEVSNALESEIAVRRNGQVTVRPTKDLVPGDVVLLVGGTIIPADVRWRSGDKMQIDTAAMTGEPIPRKYPSLEYGDCILSGTTVLAGECYAQVVATGTNTEIGKAQEDILKDKSVRVVSVFQQKIMTVVQILVSASLIIVVAVLLVQGIPYGGFDDDVKMTVLSALSILIASIPIALPLVLQVNLALGASFLAKEHHAIVTSIPALQDIASMSMLCSDKTGTLTTANMSIIPERIHAADGFTKSDVILYAYLCSNADKKDDPIDRAIVSAFMASEYKDRVDDYKQTEIIGFNPSVKRVVAFVQDKDGNVLTIAKGLPAKIIDTAAGAMDDHELQWKVQRFHDQPFIQNVADIDTGLSRAGYKTIGIAVCPGNARELGERAIWKFAGLMPMLDPPREDTPATIASLQHANISVKMITGDHVNVGKETARLVGLGTDIRAGEEIRNSTISEQEKKMLIWQADGFAAVLPSDKREVVMILRNEFGLVTGMTGDGVNDAPALSAAQVGIAVEGATDAAKNAADLILTKPGLQPIYGAVLESRRIFARIKSYVIYRVAASLVMVLTLSTIIFACGCAVDSLLVIILALLNDISMIPVAYDNAKATTKPQLPNAKKLVIMALFYGLTQTLLSLIFIFSYAHAQSVANPIELNRTCNQETRGFIWFHLVLNTELMVFSVRAGGFMLSSLPSIYLFTSIMLTCIASVFIAVYASGLAWFNALWIVIFNVGALFLLDLLKIYFLQIIHESPGDVIETDELLPAKPLLEMTDTQKQLQKKMRYVVHNESILAPEDRKHVVQIRRKSVSTLDAFFDMTPTGITDGFVGRSIAQRQIILEQHAVVDGVQQRRKQSSTPW